MSHAYTWAGLALGICLPLAAPALAEPESRSAIVRISDLDLSAAEDQQALQHRITYAVTQVCGAMDDRNLAARAPIRACRVGATAGAQSQISPLLASAKSGKPEAVASIKIAPRRS
jgi:UrcA family protein